MSSSQIKKMAQNLPDELRTLSVQHGNGRKQTTTLGLPRLGY